MDRAALYKLVVAQLADDGYHGAAQAVAQATGTPGSSVLALPSGALHSLLNGNAADALAPASATLRSPNVAPYRQRCAESVGAHRAVVRFSADGKQLAVGTSDGLVHVLDTESLLLGKGSAESALRRYAEHSAAVNDVDYHPSGGLVVSASEDKNLQFFDVSAANAHNSGPVRTCTDTHPARSAAFHPKGDHLLVGTSHAALHLYDIATFRCFLSPEGAHHQHAITEARWAADGSAFASCAAGEVKLWDGSSCKCVATLHRPHGGTPVGSVRFSASGTYLLTGGADSAVNLWDVRMLKAAKKGGGGGPAPVRIFEGATQSSSRRVATFSHDESLVLAADEPTGAVVLWSSTTAEVVGRCLGHTRPVFCIAPAPTYAAFVSTGEEGALRAWAPGAVEATKGGEAMAIGR